MSGYPGLQSILLAGPCAVSHADSLLRALGRLWGKSKFTDGDVLWVTFLGQRAGNSRGRRKHLLLLDVPCTGDQAEIQLWGGMEAWKVSIPGAAPTMHLLLTLSPGWTVCVSAGSISPLVFCPAVGLPLSFPFSWPNFSFSCSFCSLSPGPFSSHCELSVSPWVLSWPLGHAAPREGRAPGWRTSWELSMGCSSGWRGWHGRVSRRPTAQRGTASSRVVQV